MKIGIMTVYNSENCGSHLQANALFKTIQDLGHTPVFIESIDWFSSSTGRWPGLLINIAKHIARGNLSGAIMLYKRHQVFKKINEQKTLCTHQEIDKLDICIIGSDTIWNFHEIYCRKWSNLYSGRDFSVPFVYYAASCGNIKYDDLKRYNIDFSTIVNSRAISVRDNNTKELVQTVTKRIPTMVVDPTFLVPKVFFDEYDVKSNDGNFIVVYCFGKLDNDLQEEIKILSNKLKLNVVTFGNRYSFTTEVVPNDPYYFISYFKKARFIITNTFHGTVFSIIYHKQFVVVTSKKDKINDVLNNFNLDDRICDNNLYSKITKEINYSEIESLIRVQKDSSLDFLKSNIF